MNYQIPRISVLDMNNVLKIFQIKILKGSII